jgi:hypothetical protein
MKLLPMRSPTTELLPLLAFFPVSSQYQTFHVPFKTWRNISHACSFQDLAEHFTYMFLSRRGGTFHTHVPFKTWRNISHTRSFQDVAEYFTHMFLSRRGGIFRTRVPFKTWRNISHTCSFQDVVKHFTYMFLSRLGGTFHKHTCTHKDTKVYAMFHLRCGTGSKGNTQKMCNVDFISSWMKFLTLALPFGHVSEV